MATTLATSDSQSLSPPGSHRAQAPRRWVVALAALLLWPCLLLADTAVAVNRGWSPRSIGSFRLIPLAVAALVASIVLLFCMPAVRRIAGARWRHCWLLAAAFLGAFLVADGLVQSVCPQPDFHRRVAGADYVFQPNSAVMPGVDGTAHTRFNAWGLRGPAIEDAGAKRRVLCIGGSTTECLYLDDSEAWPAVAMTRLDAAGRPTWIAATAGGDLSTGDHLRFISDAEAIGQVDCLVLMPGANDLMRFLLRLGADAHRPPVWYDSNLTSAARQLWNGKLRHGFVWDRTGQELARMQSDRAIPAWHAAASLDAELEAYRGRLRAIALAARSRGVRLVMITQPVLWDDFLTELSYRMMRFARMMPTPREWEYLRPGNLRELIDRYNDALVDICREERIEAIDASSAMSGQGQYFYDDYHLSEAGCAKLGELVSSWLLEHPVERRK